MTKVDKNCKKEDNTYIVKNKTIYFQKQRDMHYQFNRQPNTMQFENLIKCNLDRLFTKQSEH